MIFFKLMTKKKFPFTALFLLAVLGINLIFSPLTHAYVWDLRDYTSSGRNSYSYFDNRILYTTNGYCPTNNRASVLPEVYSGNAIPDTINSVNDLVNFLKINNRQDASGNSCTYGKWQKSGSAFIVQSMLGRNGDQANANSGRNIVDADFNELTLRLNAASIDWNQANVSTDGLNTESLWNNSNKQVDVGHFRQLKTNTAIVITSAGGNVYKIYRQCANPIGVTNGVSPVQNWNIGVAVSVDRPTALPGTQINWTHTVTNNGPAVASGVRYGSNTGPTQFGPTGIASAGTSTNSTSYTVTQADVGTSVCRSTVASPRSNTDGSSIGSAYACVAIPYSYKLTPTMTVNRTSGGVGAPVIIQPSVTNSGPTKSQPVDWQVARFIINPGVAVPAGNVSALAPCAYVRSQAASAVCTEKFNSDSASGAVFGLGVSTLTGTNDTLTDLAVGSRVCYILSVIPNANDNSNYRHSQPACVVISKAPLMQVLGGDLRVGAAMTGDSMAASIIRTSVTIKTDKSYGSWGEYGLYAPGTITGAGSGSSYSGGITCISSCATNGLSFANTPSVGGFVPTTKIPAVAASFPITSTTPTFTNLSGAARNRVETGTGAITISGGVIAPGQWLVINAPNATVTITGDITYANGPFDNITKIPQLIIIADQINIENNVSNVDAWLIASGPSGVINTCSKSGTTAITTATQLTTNLCQNKLTINGPVMAKKLYLQRTAGAGRDKDKESSNPAEVINLRPDAYLWGIAHNANSGRLTTVYETELPPRF